MGFFKSIKKAFKSVKKVVKKAFKLVGDVITSVDGKRPSTMEDLLWIIWQKEVGDLVELEILRDEEMISVKATLGKEAMLDVVLPPSDHAVQSR